MAKIPSCAAGVPIFRALPEESLAELGAAMRHRQFAKGELVMAAGEPLDSMVVVARGRLKLAYTSRSGREQVVRTLGPGEFLGEMGLFVPTVLESDLVALEETSACLLPRQAVQAILHRTPDLSLRLVEALAQRLATAEQRIVDLGARDVGERLAAELLRLAPEGAPGPDGITLRLPVTWGELAVALGTTPESLSRRLRALVEQGLLRQEGQRIVVIRDLERLRELVEG